jgi:hypothetical protein
MLDIDVLNIFQHLLQKHKVTLNNRKCITITDKTGNTTYATIKSKNNNFNIQKDEKLYNDVKNILNFMEKRLEIAKMLNNTDILWQNN